MAALIKSQITLVDMTDVLIQSSEPAAPIAGTKWINTGSSPYVLYTYSNNATWVVETDYDILNAFSMHDIVLEDMTADGRLTPYEKSQLIKIISPKLTDAYTLESQASALGSSTVTELSNAIGALESLYNTYITALPDGTSDVSPTFDADVNAAIEDLALAMAITSSDVRALNESVVVSLSKDSYLIPGYIVNAKTSSTTVDVTAYKGMTAIPVSVAVSGQVTGLTTSVANNNTLKATVTVNTAMTMTTQAGSLLFTVTANEKTYQKDFVYAIALTGDYGYTISLTNESITFLGGVSAALEGSATTQIVAYKGGTQLAVTVGAITTPTGMTITKVNNGTVNSSLQIDVTSGLTPLSGQIIVPFTTDGRSMFKTFSYSVSLKGDSGGAGPSGKDAIYAIVSAPLGEVFRSIGGSVPTDLTLTCDLYVGGVVVDENVTYQWYIMNGSQDEGSGAGFGWKELNIVTPYGTSGYKEKTLTVVPAAVPSSESFKCKASYDGVGYFDIATLRDVTDPYQVNIECLQGFSFLNGGGIDKTLTARVYQNGTEIDLNGTVFNYDWQKFTGGIQDIAFSSVTKSITITSEDVDKSATYICNVSTRI